MIVHKFPIRCKCSLPHFQWVIFWVHVYVVCLIHVWACVFNILQIDEEELEFDATLIIRLLQKHDENFANCYHEINESNYEVFVTDALKALVTAPAYNAESTQNYQITQATYAVISIFFQWLTRYFCKCLMQLMTSEALTVHHLNIPRPYIWSYLHEQHHFSLKDLIEKHFRMLKHSSK